MLSNEVSIRTPSSVFAANGDGEWPPDRMANFTRHELRYEMAFCTSAVEGGCTMQNGVPHAVADLG